ncbi:MAG: ion transporter [Candidatus Sumerlaeia bacterium]|nr:ion transporter [Candidatus Sumerlaeia bacterium]
MLEKWKQKTWEALEPESGLSGIKKFIHMMILVVILLNVIAAIISTVAFIDEQFGRPLLKFEMFSLFLFTFEYAARVWSCTVSPKYKGAIRGRLKYMRTPYALIDLLAILPGILMLASVIGVGELDGRPLRILRLLRVARLLKLSRYSESLQLMTHVLRSRRHELLVTMSHTILLLLLASCLIYFAERGEQPEEFSSIPASMWWAIATLTTVGYGDIYPVTTLGKTFGGFVAILGIGLFALPAGILASGFSEVLEKKRRREEEESSDGKDGSGAWNHCPHCGEPLK